ncbi:MAG: family 10 glycosylhydrolase, partial [bacterium]
DVITSFVREVRREIRAIRPGIQLSAAVFPVPASARATVLQDWGRWIKEGLVDFVCPMNYTEDLGEMRHRAQAGLEIAGGKVPVLQGLYATFDPGRVQPPDALAAQIVASRELGAGGFVLFELQDHVITDVLPLLRRGVTAP